MTTPLTPEGLEAILNGPALLAPTGVKYQFINPPNMNLTCFTTIGVFLVLALWALSIRIYIKLKVIRGLDWEDCELHLIYSSPYLWISGC